MQALIVSWLSFIYLSSYFKLNVSLKTPFFLKQKYILSPAKEYMID